MRTLALITLCLWLVGCHKWTVMDPPYADAIIEQQPGEIRIVTTSGDSIAVYNAVVVGDSIVGVDKDKDTPVAVALDQVADVDHRKTDAVAVFGIGLAAIVVVAGVAYLIARDIGQGMQ